MSSWLLDASVLLASEDRDDAHHRDARRLLTTGEQLWTLDLAFYETANVAVRSWGDAEAADRLRTKIIAIGEDGGLVRADSALVEAATALAREHTLSAYDAAYVAAARSASCTLVSCDVRDLVSAGLAVLPGDALTGR